MLQLRAQLGQLPLKRLLGGERGVEAGRTLLRCTPMLAFLLERGKAIAIVLIPLVVCCAIGAVGMAVFGVAIAGLMAGAAQANCSL